MKTNKIASEIIDVEFDLLEFNLFISSCGKKKIKKINSKINILRRENSEGKINLSEYENLAEEF